MSDSERLELIVRFLWSIVMEYILSFIAICLFFSVAISCYQQGYRKGLEAAAHDNDTHS